MTENYETASHYPLSHIANLRCSKSPVLVICTTNRPDLLDKTYRTLCFGMEHAVRIPNKCARESILQALCIKHHLADDVSLSDIADFTRGYVGSDLKSLIDKAIFFAESKVISEHNRQSHKWCGTSKAHSRTDRLLTALDGLMLTNTDFSCAEVSEKSSLCQENGIIYSHTTWDDLGGLDSIRRTLELDLMDFQDEVRRPEMYENLGLRVLLHGPSGCGKTSIAKAFANDAEMNLLYVKGEELLSEVIGQTADNVRVIFKRARSLTQCLIFIDELHSLCPNILSENHEKSVNNATTQLLIECLLLEPGSEIYVMAATINLVELDPELLKVGRIKKTIHVGLPSPEERVEILRALAKCSLDADFDCTGKDRRCDGFSGADLELFLDFACDASNSRFIAPTEACATCETFSINKTDFDIAFENMNDAEARNLAKKMWLE